MLRMLKPSLIYFTVLLRGITCVECKATGWQQKGSFGLEILSQESSSSVSVPFFSSYLIPNMSSHRRISIAVMNTDFHSYSQSFMHLSFYLVLAFRSVRKEKQPRNSVVCHHNSTAHRILTNFTISLYYFSLMI